MENSDLTAHLLDFSGEISSPNMPKWQDLPDLDLYMDQVISFMCKHLGIFCGDAGKLITPSMINNYVKLGVIPPPIKKKYTREHLARLMMICMLKQILPISAVASLAGSSMDDSGPAISFDKFSLEQDCALKSCAEALTQDIKSLPEQELRAQLSHIALTLSAQANARRILAEKITSLLG